MFTSTTKAIVTGASAHKGSFENKQKEVVEYDYLQFHIQTQLKTAKDFKAGGFATVKCRIKDKADDYDNIFGSYKFPVLAELEYLEATTGDGTMSKEYLQIRVLQEIDLTDLIG